MRISNKIKKRIEKLKSKIRSKAKQIKKLKKRQKELIDSRNKWKKKAQRIQNENEKLKKEIKKLKRESKKSNKNIGKKPKRYCHSISLIQLVLVIKLKTSTSFRAVAKIIIIIDIYLKMSFKTPTYQTVLIWVEKIGYYQLTKKKQIANDWIIILDHSIKIGQEKLLLIYGFRESEINFNRPLKFKDLTPLREIIEKKWTGDLMAQILSELENELGKIIYAVGDYGSDIKKGLELSNIVHIHDITHHIALILEKMYKNDKQYQEICQKLSHMRMTLSQTSISHLLPNQQRQKSRYLNMKPISDYTTNILKLLEKTTDDKIIEKFSWLENYRSFVEELAQISDVICEIEQIVKVNGLSEETIKKCHKVLARLFTDKGKQLKEKLGQYFDITLKYVPGKKCILCTSDIIESAFGKYKNYISCNSMAGITSLALCLSAFTCSLKKEEIKEALENTRMEDLKNWIKENIGTTSYTKRKLAFSGG